MANYSLTERRKEPAAQPQEDEFKVGYVGLPVSPVICQVKPHGQSQEHDTRRDDEFCLFAMPSSSSSSQVLEILFHNPPKWGELLNVDTDDENCPEDRQANESVTETYEYSPLYSPEEQQQPPSATTRVVRLLHLLPGTRQEDIRCWLVVADLDHVRDQYEALSYVWGDVSQKTPVQIDDKTLYVGTNLRKALLNLRLTDSIRILWADAICIDQTSVDERNRQVAIMGEIFRSASRSLIWLGDADKEMRWSLTLLAKVSKDATAAKNDPGCAPDFQTDRIYKHLRTDPLLNNILANDWWGRAWTVQEIVLAKKALLVAGPYHLDWEVASAAIKYLRDNDILTWSMFGMSVESTAIRYNAYEALKKSPEFTSAAAEEFLEYIIQTRRRNSTDPRDKIFSVLGLVRADIKDLGIQPDYNMSVEDVYTNMTRRLIEQTGTYDILGLCFPFQDSKLSDKPSWVADLSSSSRITPPLRNDARDAQRRTHASRRTTADAHFEDGNKVLVAQGHVIDTIISVSQVQGLLESDDDNFLQMISDETTKMNDHKLLPKDTSDESTPSNNKSALRGIRSVIHNIPVIIHNTPVVAKWTYSIARELVMMAVKQLTIYVEWEIFVKDLKPTNPDAKSTGPLAIYCRTLCTGTYAPGGVEETEAMFRDWMDKLTPVRRMRKWNVDKAASGVYNIVGLAAYVQRTWGDFGEFVQYLGQAEGRKLGSSGKGYLCLLPRSAAPGDQLVILKGGRVPVILRPLKDGDVAFVGEAYVHGIMNGEAFHRSECVDVRIR